MKKVLFFINTLGTGGAEHVLVDIANSLDPQKFDITIKTIYDINVYKNSINENIMVESFYHTKKNKFIDKVFRKLLYLKIMNYSNKKLYEMFVKENYDIEIAFLEGLPTKIISGSTNKNSKKIAWVHCDLEINKESDIFFKNDLEHKRTYQKYNEIYCVSHKAKDALKNRFKINKNVYTLYNIIRKEEIIQKSKEKVKMNKRLKLITVGRLTKQKGYIRLVEVFANILDKLKQIPTLYIIGDGEEKENIAEKIKEKNLQDKVILLGRQDNPYKYIKECDLYVCSSYSEGYSLVTQEALTLNIPVLSTDCADQKYVLNNGMFGLIVDNSNTGLEKGLIELINNNEKLKQYKENIKNNYDKFEIKIETIEKQILQ